VWLHSQQTNRDITKATIQGLEHWHHSPSLTLMKDFVVNRWKDQNQLGWEVLLDGWVAQLWSNQQGLIFLAEV